MKATKQATSKTSSNGKRAICVCGCGTACHRLFAQGHDQRVRGMLLRNAENRKANPLPKTLLAAIRAGVVKHLQRVQPNATVLA